jgi:hypothetical protein
MKKFCVTLFALTSIFVFTTGMAFADSSAVANSQTEAGAAALIDQSGQNNISEAPDRGFPVPGGVGYGPVINYYGKPLPGSQFRPVESLLMYANVFSEGALEEIIRRGKDADLIVDLNVIRDRNVQARASYEKGETRWIKIVATTQMLPEHGIIGYITSESDDRKTDMMEVVAGAALAALREGADVMQIVAQGAARDTETSGWGIGFNTTMASNMNGHDGTMNVSSGGTGYSTAWAGMRDKPWIQANALKAPVKIVGVVAKADPTDTDTKTMQATAAPKDDTMKVEKASVDAPIKEVKKDAEKKVWGTINGKTVYIAE